MEKGGINPVQLEFEEGLALKDGTINDSDSSVSSL
jgi:hypothetical protein